MGTGPGDPNLLTLGAVDAINRAQVIVISCAEHRMLLGSDFLGLRPDVRIVLAGGVDEEAAVLPSQPGTGAPTPVDVDEHCADVTATVIDAASQGLEVVRLVSGDPFLDGDIGAEAAAVARADYDVDVVPGVTGMTAVPEYAGLTLHGHDVQLIGDAACQRDIAGHGSNWSDQGLSSSIPRQASLKKSSNTRLNLDAVRMSPRPYLPCATTQQTTHTVTLGELPQTAKTARLGDAEPVHVAIGKVVEAPEREQLDWYESKPLFGWNILIPRTRDHSATLPSRLQSYGAHSLDVPTISMEPPRTPQQMDKAIRGLVEGRYEWVVFTSANAVRAVSEKLEQIGLDARAYSGLRIAAIFDSTINALAEWGVRPDFVHRASSPPELWPRYSRPLTRPSTPLTAFSCRVPTSPLSPCRPTYLNWDGRSKTSSGIAPCELPRRQLRPVKPLRPANSTPSCLPPRRLCATSSVLPENHISTPWSPPLVCAPLKPAVSTA